MLFKSFPPNHLLSFRFQTQIEKPGQPKLPEINGRKTNSLAIKWKFSADGRTGGSPIDKWIMLWDQGKDLPMDSFVQVYEGPKTSFRVSPRGCWVSWVLGLHCRWNADVCMHAGGKAQAEQHVSVQSAGT